MRLMSLPSFNIRINQPPSIGKQITAKDWEIPNPYKRSDGKKEKLLYHIYISFGVITAYSSSLYKGKIQKQKPYRDHSTTVGHIFFFELYKPYQDTSPGGQTISASQS